MAGPGPPRGADMKEKDVLGLGVDIGGTKIAAGVVDDEGRIVDRARSDTSSSAATSIDEAVGLLYRELSARHHLEYIGVAAAGLVSNDRSTVRFAPNIAWRDYPLGQRLREQVGPGVPVVVENDANGAAWAEWRFGAGAQAQCMLMLTIGTGIGGALVLDGAMFRGSSGLAAEVGHMCMVPGGHRCGCGQLGCWETYGSGSALVREARAAAVADPDAARSLLRLAGGEPGEISGVHVTTAAQAGDPLAVRLLADLGTWIGRGAASLASLVDPEVIVVGGGVADAGDLLFTSLRAAYTEHLTAADHRTAAPVVPATLGNDAGMVGAAHLALTGLVPQL